MKPKHIFWIFVIAVDILIFSISIFTISPINYFHFSLLLVIIVVLLFLGKEYATKMNQKKIIDTMFASNEFLFQTHGQSAFTDYLVQQNSLLGNEKVIQTFYKNYFLFKLQETSEKEILSYLNKVVTSLLYNRSVEVRNGLNQAIVNSGAEKYAHPCAAVIAEANEEGYKYRHIVEIIELAFSLADNNEALKKLGKGINDQVDIYTYLFSDQEKELIDKFKIYLFEEKSKTNEEKSMALVAAD